MTRVDGLFARLEQASDRVNPIVVKEVRQLVRGREFVYSLSGGLVAGLAVAFFGAAEALTATGTTGRWTFVALMVCLTLLGLIVVPIGAFSALRNERMEQTLELITLTALRPRRVVTGKLLAQGVKLATLFAAMAPFVAMSFLLGGIDFETILISLTMLLMWSLWMCSAGLFLSVLLKSRAMVGLVFSGFAIVILVLLGAGRLLFYAAVSGITVFPGGLRFGLSWSDVWWGLAMMTSFCAATMINLVLLAENRLSLATEDRVTDLRVGFLVQFLLILGWALSYLHESPRFRADVVTMLGVFGGLHLALVAMFTLTEDLILPRRVLLHAARRARARPLRILFQPGGGSGALYVLVQMALLLAAARLLQPSGSQFQWLLAICAYICAFSGIPTLAFRLARPASAAAAPLRVSLLLLLPLAMLLPDVIHYLVWRPETLDLSYSARHLINPLRTLMNWRLVGERHWVAVPIALGVIGLFGYAGLIRLGTRLRSDIPAADSPSSARQEPSADVLY